MPELQNTNGKHCVPFSVHEPISVATVFSLAYKLQLAIIFIDEVDSFLGQRKSTDHEAPTNMKTEVMGLWDGFTTISSPAILRRLPWEFEIGIPDRGERAEILKVILKDEKVEDDIGYDHITGSDILGLCKKALPIFLSELRPLSQLDLEKVISTMTKTIAAASEYSRLSSYSSGWSMNRESDDFQVQAAISELSKLVFS
ncbi:P-loop containing nucleoside triphosphate hydrolase superfamily protein [Forsythia ovata]|uniref:P-loop containing nucleoside triphosphate hydrolase superfamily protein n=1 Tax=Forsythia ovata TaxID=205694 RepID=A0ABD1X754_9LAMI